MRARPCRALFSAVGEEAGIARAGLAFLHPVGALVSPGLNSLPSWNTVRLEPCCAFRREATCAPAQHALVSTRSRGRFPYGTGTRKVARTAAVLMYRPMTLTSAMSFSGPK